MQRRATRLRAAIVIGLACCVVYCYPALFLPRALGDQQQVAEVDASEAPAAAWSPKSQDIRQMQVRLRELGFNPGPADGTIGPRTTAALQKYQGSIGEDADGKVTLELFQRLTTGKVPPVEPPAAATDQGAKTKCTPTLTGAWQFEDGHGSRFALTFRQDGSVAGTSYPEHWRWRATAQDIEIIYDNGMGTTVTRTGHLSDRDLVRGDARDSRGRTWVWKAVRLPSDLDIDQGGCQP